MRLLINTLILLTLFVSSVSIAQETKSKCQILLDSGEYYLYETRNYDAAKTNLFNAKSCFLGEGKEIPGKAFLFLARVYFFQYEDSLSAVNFEAAVKSFEAEQDTTSLSTVLNSYGNLISSLGYYDSSLYLFNRSIEYAESSDNQLGIAIAMNNKGNALKGLGRYDEALETLYKSLETYQAADASELRLSKSMLNIGALLDIIGKPDKAMDFYRNSIKLKSIAGDSVGIARIYNNIGVIQKNSNRYDSALFYYDKGLNLSRTLDQKDLLWNNLINIGNIQMFRKQYQKAYQTFNESLAVAKNMNAQDRIGESYYQLGLLKFAEKDTLTALVYFQEALPIVQKTKSYQDLLDLYDFLSIGNFTKGDYKTAYQYRLLRDQNKDSVYQEAKVAAMEDVVEKYESDKKDSEITFLNQENELKTASLQRNTLLLITLGVLLVLVIGLFYFLRYRSRQSHQAVLQEQKVRMRESQMQAVIDSQESERKRFATDLHDGMGQLVSALQLNIQAMNQTNGDLDKRDELYKNSTNLLKDVHKEIRNIAFNLMPQTLTKEGLVAAVKELIKRVNKTEQIKVHLSEIDMEERLSEVAEVSLYRIIQELLSNIMKYSKASNVYLGLTNHGDELVFMLEDDGEGYNLEKFKVSEGNGWRNINTRLNLIKAEIEIDTKEGKKGTSTIINMPLAIKKEKELTNN